MNSMKVKRFLEAATLLALFVTIALPAYAGDMWIAAWGAPIASTAAAPSNATVRNIARVTLDGSAVRIRLSNALSSTTPLSIGAAYIALQENPSTPALVPGTSHRLTFGGKPSITIAPGTGYIYSDPVNFPVKAQQNVAVSLYLPETSNPPAWTTTYNTSYVSASGSGNQTQDETGSSYSPANNGALPTVLATPLAGTVPDNCPACNTYALTGVDVFTAQANGSVVGLGSSTFQGFNSTPNGYNRVLDLVSVKINQQIAYGAQKGIVNMGIGGDTLHAGLNRVQRDVFSETGVFGVIVYDINDIAFGRTAEEVEADYLTLIAESHQRGIRVFCSTWAPESTDLTAEGTAERERLNAWILNAGACDDIVDWATVLQDPNVPQMYLPAYQSDTIHPNAAGHAAMAEATPDRWFTLPRLKPTK